MRRRFCHNYPTLCSLQFRCSVVSDSLQPRESQHTRPPCPSPTPGVYSNPCPLSRWCHPIISSSVVPFSSCPQSIPTLYCGAKADRANLYFNVHGCVSVKLHLHRRWWVWCDSGGLFTNHLSRYNVRVSTFYSKVVFTERENFWNLIPVVSACSFTDLTLTDWVSPAKLQKQSGMNLQN